MIRLPLDRKSGGGTGFEMESEGVLVSGREVKRVFGASEGRGLE